MEYAEIKFWKLNKILKIRDSILNSIKILLAISKKTYLARYLLILKFHRKINNFPHLIISSI